MKRVTLLVDDAVPGDKSLLAHTALHFAGDIAYVLTERVESVEEVYAPLPTIPGTRFWGRLLMEDDMEPQWFMVQKSPTRTGHVTYASADGFHVADVETERTGLVRLPDPEAAP